MYYSRHTHFMCSSVFYYDIPYTCLESVYSTMVNSLNFFCFLEC